jgi:multicomponent Na+:H+ antiporter subunit E
VDATRVVLDPALEEVTHSRVAAVAASGRPDLTVESAPVGRRVRHPRIALPRTPRRTGVTFLVAFGFYLVLGDATKPFDVVTGLLSAAVVALTLSRVAFESDPPLASLGRVARAVLYLPYLLVEVVRANLAVAWAVLHPDLPIDPRIVRVPAPEGRVARALLANSITLTPGTLTVDIVDDLVVHTLTAGTRAGLEDGALARAVAFVMDGRAAPTADGDGGAGDGR